MMITPSLAKVQELMNKDYTPKKIPSLPQTMRNSILARETSVGTPMKNNAFVV